LADLITPSVATTVRPGLRSAASNTVAVPRTTSSLGDRSFAAAGPRAWNKLPPPLRRVFSDATFKRQLNTFHIITLLIHIVRHPCCVSALTSPCSLNYLFHAAVMTCRPLNCRREFELQSNDVQTAVESKYNRSCDRRLTAVRGVRLTVHSPRAQCMLSQLLRTSQQFSKKTSGYYFNSTVLQAGRSS